MLKVKGSSMNLDDALASDVIFPSAVSCGRQDFFSGLHSDSQALAYVHAHD